MPKWNIIDRPAFLFYHNDKFDDGVIDLATSAGTEQIHTYSSTIRNGTLLEEDGYLKTKVNDPATTGYTRLVLTHKLAYAPHTLFARSDFIVKSWFQYSDIALGFSFERDVGSTAYRGDLALWIDRDIAKIYHRPSRDAAVTTIDIGEIYLNPDDSFITTIQYHNGVFVASITKNDVPRITASANVGTTFDNNVYAMLGGRGSEQVTEFWSDRFLVSTGRTPWTKSHRPPGDWTIISH